jgi:hypothetical protein
VTRVSAAWTQLELGVPGASDHEAAWQMLLKLIRAEVDRRGLKEIAYDLDVAPSLLSHCLNERERHNVPAKWIAYFVMKADNDDIVAFLALLRGLKVEPRQQMKPEEEVARYRQWVASLPESMRKAVSVEVYGDDETSRFRKK